MQQWDSKDSKYSHISGAKVLCISFNESPNKCTINNLSKTLTALQKHSETTHTVQFTPLKSDSGSATFLTRSELINRFTLVGHHQTTKLENGRILLGQHKNHIQV